MIPADYVISALATLMYNEPKDDLLLGYVACGLIVRNRKLAGWVGGDWMSVIRDHDKWSANPTSVPRALKFGDPNHDEWFRRCLAKAEMIYNGNERDITATPDGKGAKWYGRLDTCSDWFKENIVRQPNDHPMIATIGLQKFFL